MMSEEAQNAKLRLAEMVAVTVLLGQRNLSFGPLLITLSIRGLTRSW